MTQTDSHKAAMLKALAKTLGNVKEACEVVDIARQTHYTWLKEDEDYKLAVENITEDAIDYVEGKLFEKITGVMVKKGETDDGEDIIYNLPPSDVAIIFFLKTRAKKRGYVERNEFTGADGGALLINMVPSNNCQPVNERETQ